MTRCLAAKAGSTDQQQRTHKPLPKCVRFTRSPANMTNADFTSALRTQDGICQVPHCCNDLPADRPYFIRNRICPDHHKAQSLVLQSTPVRFCQQCARFQPLEQFERNRRSCRAGLEMHNARRRGYIKARPDVQPATAPPDPSATPYQGSTDTQHAAAQLQQQQQQQGQLLDMQLSATSCNLAGGFGTAASDGMQAAAIHSNLPSSCCNEPGSHAPAVTLRPPKRNSSSLAESEVVPSLYDAGWSNCLLDNSNRHLKPSSCNSSRRSRRPRLQQPSGITAAAAAAAAAEHRHDDGLPNLVSWPPLCQMQRQVHEPQQVVGGSGPGTSLHSQTTCSPDPSHSLSSQLSHQEPPEPLHSCSSAGTGVQQDGYNHQTVSLQQIINPCQSRQQQQQPGAFVLPGCSNSSASLHRQLLRGPVSPAGGGAAAAVSAEPCFLSHTMAAPTSRAASVPASSSSLFGLQQGLDLLDHVLSDKQQLQPPQPQQFHPQQQQQLPQPLLPQQPLSARGAGGDTAAVLASRPRHITPGSLELARSGTAGLNSLAVTMPPMSSRRQHQQGQSPQQQHMLPQPNVCQQQASPYVALLQELLQEQQLPDLLGQQQQQQAAYARAPNTITQRPLSGDQQLTAVELCDAQQQQHVATQQQQHVASQPQQPHLWQAAAAGGGDGASTAASCTMLAGVTALVGCAASVGMPAAAAAATPDVTGLISSGYAAAQGRQLPIAPAPAMGAPLSPSHLEQLEHLLNDCHSEDLDAVLDIILAKMAES